MELLRAAVAAVLAAAAAGSAIADSACPAPGVPVQWIADWCMMREQTDDEIAVSGCIARESRQRFANSCASNLHFKQRMCELAIRRGTYAGTLAQCVRDPGFHGLTVGNGGVPG